MKTTTPSKLSMFKYENEYGQDTYEFSANKTKYTLIINIDCLGNTEYHLYSKRESLSRMQMPTLKIYVSLDELSNRSKALHRVASTLKEFWAATPETATVQ